MRTFSSLKNRKVVTEGGRKLGRCHDLRGELTSSSLRVTALVVGRQGFLEQSLREAINLRLGSFSAREDAEVDDELGAALSFARKNQCRIGHAPLIPSRGSHLNIRPATTSPSMPQTSTAAIAPGDEVSVSPSMKVDRIRRKR